MRIQRVASVHVMPLDTFVPTRRPLPRGYLAARGAVAALVRTNGQRTTYYASAAMVDLWNALGEGPRGADELMCEMPFTAVDCQRLMLDGLLDVEHNGAFVSGPEAAETLPASSIRSPQWSCERVSHSALQCAARHPTANRRQLARYLYHFASLPVGNARRLAPPSRARLDNIFKQAGWSTVERDGWLIWNRADARTLSGPRYKLYVAPTVHDWPDVVRAAAQTIADSAAVTFKVSASAEGCLRSDKCVGYFESYEELASAAARLSPRLGQTRGYPVPFTAALDESGVLSWGLDPTEPALVGTIACRSWRTWVSTRLAGALADAKTFARGSTDPVGFALRVAAHHGIDVGRWSPISPRWNDASLL